jgi:methionyl-tRNA formyltransferase
MKTKRVIFCTYSSVYSSIVLEKLIVDESVEVVAIINSTRVIHPKYGFIRGGLKQVQVSGLRYASYLFIVTDLFRWLQIFSNVIKSVVKLNLKKSVHSLAKQHSIPLLDTVDMNRTESLNFIKQNKPDYLLGAHLNQLVKPIVLDLPNMACINIHPSILPSYKGVDPVFYALLNKETEIGVTLHKMSEEFDSGEILATQTLSTKATDLYHSVYFYNCQLFEEGVKLAIEWMDDETTVGTVINKANKASDNYDSWPSRTKVKQFKQAGNHLISLSELRKN